MKRIKCQIRSRTIRYLVVAAVVVLMMALVACAPKATPSLAETNGSETSEIEAENAARVGLNTYPETKMSSYLNLNERGCDSCHDDLWEKVIDLGYADHMAGSAPGYGKKASYLDCFACHAGYKDTGIRWEDGIHAIHLGNSQFEDGMNGNCMSCHAFNGNTMLMYDLYRESPDFGGWAANGSDPMAFWLEHRGYGETTGAGITMQKGGFDASSATFVNEPTAKEDRFTASNHGSRDYTDMVEKGEWSLKITGGVKNPREFTLDDLKAMPQVERTDMHICAANTIGSYQIANIPYKGVMLTDIIEACGGLEDGVQSFLGTGMEDWVFAAIGNPRASCDTYLENAFIALEEWGAPMEPKNGYPAVLCIPGLPAGGWIKWISSIDFSDEEGMHETYSLTGQSESEYRDSIYTDIASKEFVESVSNFEMKFLYGYVSGGWWNPADDDVVLTRDASGKITLKGYAYSIPQPGHQVTKLSFSADYGNTWTEVDVPQDLDPGQIATWTIDWTPEKPGTYVLYLGAHDKLAGWQKYVSPVTVVVE